MTDILLSNENMQYINMVSKITKADILDCVINDDKLIFIVHQGQLGLVVPGLGDASGVNLGETWIGESSSFLVGTPNGGGVTSLCIR